MAFRTSLTSTGVALAIFNQGTRLVDNPLSQTLTLTGPGSSVLIDVSQALSLDLSWLWQAGTSRTGPVFGRLRFDWLDAAGALIYRDAVEVVNLDTLLTFGGNSQQGIVRAPAVGARLLLTFEAGVGSGPIVAADFATIRLVLSNRTTDRFRYIGTPSPSGTPAVDSGVLLNTAAVVAANGSLKTYALAFDGPTDLLVSASQAGTVSLFFGALPVAYFFNLAALQAVRIGGLICPRTHLSVNFAAGGAAANWSAQLVRSSV